MGGDLPECLVVTLMSRNFTTATLDMHINNVMIISLLPFDVIHSLIIVPLV